MSEGGSVSLSKALVVEFDNQEDCDVMFTVDGKTIGAHKLVLKAVRQMRRNSLKESRMEHGR